MQSGEGEGVKVCIAWNTSIEQYFILAAERVHLNKAVESHRQVPFIPQDLEPLSIFWGHWQCWPSSRSDSLANGLNKIVDKVMVYQKLIFFTKCIQLEL